MPHSLQELKSRIHFAFVWGRLNAADEFFCSGETITQLIYNASKHTETVKKSDCEIQLKRDA